MFLLLLIAAQCSLLLVASYCGSSLLIAAYYGLLRIIADFCRWVMAHCPDSENLKAEEYDAAASGWVPSRHLPPASVPALAIVMAPAAKGARASRVVHLYLQPRPDAWIWRTRTLA